MSQSAAAAAAAAASAVTQQRREPVRDSAVSAARVEQVQTPPFPYAGLLSAFVQDAGIAADGSVRQAAAVQTVNLLSRHWHTEMRTHRVASHPDIVASIFDWASTFSGTTKTYPQDALVMIRETCRGDSIADLDALLCGQARKLCLMVEQMASDSVAEIVRRNIYEDDEYMSNTGPWELTEMMEVVRTCCSNKKADMVRKLLASMPSVVLLYLPTFLKNAIDEKDVDCVQAITEAVTLSMCLAPMYRRNRLMQRLNAIRAASRTACPEVVPMLDEAMCKGMNVLTERALKSAREDVQAHNADEAKDVVHKAKDVVHKAKDAPDNESAGSTSSDDDTTVNVGKGKKKVQQQREKERQRTKKRARDERVGGSKKRKSTALEQRTVSGKGTKAVVSSSSDGNRAGKDDGGHDKDKDDGGHDKDKDDSSDDSEYTYEDEEVTDSDATVDDEKMHLISGMLIHQDTVDWFKRTYKFISKRNFDDRSKWLAAADVGNKYRTWAIENKYEPITNQWVGKVVRGVFPDIVTCNFHNKCVYPLQEK